MPKKTEKKNVKGTKTSTSKKVTKKEIKVPETKVEVKEVKVVKKEEKKGNELLNNTPFIICCCAIVLLVATVILLLCSKRIPTTSKGDEIVATVNGKQITADELYITLKNEGGKDALLSIIDEYIADKEVTITDAHNEYVEEVVDYYKEYAEYYETDLITFLANYVGLTGISNEKEFKEFVLKDYKKTLAVQNYIAEKATDKEIENYYKENYSDKLTAKHILIEIDSEAEDKDKAEKEAYDKAVKLIKKLDKVEESKLDKKFEELAKENSDDTATYSNGGLIENFSKKDVVSEFFEAANDLKDGEYTKEPVKSSYGYHIILKVSSTPVEKLKDIKDEVKNAYAESKLSEDSALFTLKWAELRDEYKLSIKDDLIKESYKNTIKDAENTKTEE